jgi:ArsR family transcriptional regulator, arsenate/arsenite/antimonite-responsive transcriptional repressor
MAKYENESDHLKQINLIGKALSHPVRVRSLLLLRDGELCLCELSEMFDIALPTMSKHMQVLLDASLVNKRREQKWTYYALAENPAGILTSLIADLFSSLANDPVIKNDRKRRKSLASCKP